MPQSWIPIDEQDPFHQVYGDLKKELTYEFNDLIDQRGAHDFILVDGHALVHSLLSQESYGTIVDIENTQVLHFVHTLERFLLSVIERTVRFSIFFFDSPSFLEYENPVHQSIARFFEHVTYHHLKKNKLTIGIEVEKFPSWRSNEFSVFLSETRPSFIFGKRVPEKKEGEKYYTSEYEQFVLDLVINKDFVFCHSVKIQKNIVYGFCSNAMGAFKGKEAVMKFINEHAPKESTSSKKIDFENKKMKKIMEKIQNEKSDDLSDPATKIVILALANQLIQNPMPDFSLNVALAKLFLLSVVIKNNIEFKLRLQSLKNIPDADKSISPFYHSFIDSLNVIVTDENLQELVQSASLIDLYDTRLLQRCLIILKEKKDLIPNNFFQMLESYFSDFDESDFQDVIDSHFEEPEELEEEEKRPEYVCRSLMTDLFSEYFADCKVPQEENEFELDLADLGFDLDLESSNSKLEENENEDYAPKSYKEKQKTLKLEQRLHQYSESLGNITIRRTIEALDEEALLKKEVDKKKRKSELIKLESFITKTSKRFNDIHQRISIFQNVLSKELENNKKKEKIEQHIEKLLKKDEKAKKEKGEEEEGEDAEEEQKLTFDDFKRMDASVVYSEELGGKSLEDRISLIDDTLNELEQILKQIWETDKQMSEIAQEGDTDNLVAMRKDCENVLVDALKTKIEHVVEIFNKVPPATLEPYFSLFEMINICIELCIELNNTENKAKLAADSADTKKSKSGGPKNKPPKKAMEKPKSKTDKKGDKKGADKEIEAYDVEKTFQRLIQVLCTIGARKYAERVITTYAEKINPTHKLTLPTGKEFIKSHARFQLQFNQTHSSASRFLPDKDTVESKKKSEKEKQKQRYTKKDESKNLLDVSERMYGLGFEPEPWQRELIENVKKNNSALCAAPTSSGKTFIAFYVIEKILRESDDGVVVFVCPTRALVNQVYAEISSRFAKTYKYPQQNVIGMFHSFSRLNVLNSQVLITIPQSLEQLFISSAPNVMRWKKKLKYLILDEIHSISSETGEVWEHILLLADCPFVAMSATIGNPFEFKDWLNSNEEIKEQVEEVKKGKTEVKATTAVELIMHRVRPRPLEFFVFEPGCPKPISEEEKKKQEVVEQAPKISISVKEPEEEEEEAEKEEGEEEEEEEGEDKEEEEEKEKEKEKEKEESEEEEDDEDEDKMGEQQQKFLEYALNQEKGQFVEIHPASVLNTQKMNASELHNMYTLSPSQCLSLYETFEKVKQAHPELNLSQKAQDLLVRDLCPETYFKDFGLIPRGEFQQYAIDMKESLIETEKLGTEHDKKFLTTCFKEIGKPVNDSYQRQYANFGKERISEEEFMIQNFVNVVESLKKGKMLPTLIFYFDNVVCTEMFNFLRAYLMRTKLNLWENETEQLKAQKLIRLCVGQIEEQGEIRTSQDKILFSGLELGIAVHHNNVPEIYQIEVERLFRSRVLPIIICTGTLAFGVHLPCKSVVLCGNSLYMSKVLFEQCAGRAGRRGFDNKGKVVVYGCPQSKVNRLMTSDTPKIMGSMTLKIDFLVHLIRLYHFAPAAEKKGVKDSIISLLKQPLFILGRKYDNSSAAQTKYLMRHIVDFLVTEEYITSKGKLTKYARMASSITPQLFYPGNYVFIHLLKSKVIHKFLQNQEIEDGVKYEQIINLMCRIFGGVSMFMAPSEYTKEIEMPPLHDTLREGLEEYDNHLLNIFSSFATQYSTNEVQLEKSLQLVYSKQDFSKIETNDDKIPEELKEELESTAKASQVKSPFVELSGESTVYKSIPQLVAESNPNMLIDLSHFPRSEWNSTFNGYVLTFWRNGDFKKTVDLHNLKSDNSIKSGLKFFLKALRSTCDAVVAMSGYENIVAKYFNHVKEEYYKKFYQRDNRITQRKWGLSSLNTEAADMDLYGPKRTSKDSKRSYGDKFLNNQVDLEAMQRSRKGKSFTRDDDAGEKKAEEKE